MSTSDLAGQLAPTGTLRAAINLGNPVLAQGSPRAPSGLSVDLARELARRLDVGVRLICFEAARLSFAALGEGAADVGFLAVEPARAEQVAFTAPYLLIEGVYVVPADSPFTAPGDLDAEGVGIGVKRGSAYDLYLTRTLRHAGSGLVRGAEGVDLYAEQALDAGAGIRQPLTAFVAAHPGHRLIEPRFMEIAQAVALPIDRDDAAVAWVRDVVDDLKASGFVAEALARSGQVATVAPGARIP